MPVPPVCNHCGLSLRTVQRYECDRCDVTTDNLRKEVRKLRDRIATLEAELAKRPGAKEYRAVRQDRGVVTHELDTQGYCQAHVESLRRLGVNAWLESREVTDWRREPQGDQNSSDSRPETVTTPMTADGSQA